MLVSLGNWEVRTCISGQDTFSSSAFAFPWVTALKCHVPSVPAVRALSFQLKGMSTKVLVDEHLTRSSFPWGFLLQEETSPTGDAPEWRQSSPRVTDNDWARWFQGTQAPLSLLKSSHLRDRLPGRTVPEACPGWVQEMCSWRGDAVTVGSSALSGEQSPSLKPSMLGLTRLIWSPASALSPSQTCLTPVLGAGGTWHCFHWPLSLLVNSNHSRFGSPPQSIKSSSPKPGWLPAALTFGLRYHVARVWFLMKKNE